MSQQGLLAPCDAGCVGRGVKLEPEGFSGSIIQLRNLEIKKCSNPESPEIQNVSTIRMKIQHAQKCWHGPDWEQEPSDPCGDFLRHFPISWKHTKSAALFAYFPLWANRRPLLLYTLGGQIGRLLKKCEV